MSTEPEEGGDHLRRLTGNWERGAAALAVALSLGHLALALFPALLSEFARNTLHFAGFALLCALWVPAARGWRIGLGAWADLALGVLVALAAWHVASAQEAVFDRGVKLDALDWAAGITLILGAMEFSRRAAGPIIPVLIALALGYVGWWGAQIGGVFHFPGLSWESVLFRAIYGDDALFGTIARISSTTVFLFIIFGAFLVRSGAGDFVIALARAAAGRVAGGPGLVAVIASGLTGTISGSAVANTASTGVITIPLMKRAGFPPAFAAGVESAASTGGQIMPPIMGAGAFVMAAYTRIPYETIIAVSVLPAILYFFTVAFFVRIEAKRQGLGAMQDDGAQTFAQALRHGGASFFLPIGAVIALLVSGFSPSYAAVIGVGVVVAASWLGGSPMGPRAIWQALELGARNMISTAILLCAVGLVINVISTAGVGNTFSLMVAQWAGGNLLIALVLIALASLILGMGLPVTAAYIVLATLSAPALSGMIQDAGLIGMLTDGTFPQAAAPILMLANPEAAAQIMGGPLPHAEAAALIHSLPLEVLGPLRDMAITPEAAMGALLAAHMAIFWLSQDSNVTPPVCLAAFTAAAIAKSPPMYTGLQSWKLAKGLYFAPVLIVYTPLLTGTALEAAQVFALALIGAYGLAAGMQGWMEARLSWPLRLFALVCGAAAVWPAPLWAELAGAGGVIVLFLWTLRKGGSAQAIPT